ncbi:MAG: hypothetical protein HXY34_08505 [Candidatus Thorarchaeota archaeon]|nr:hypothetical protein [Candidatus Thorarchaeota archaeon]
MTQVHVLDAGVLFSDWDKRHPNAEFVTTEDVLAEVLNSRSGRRAESLMAAGRLRVDSPDLSVLEEVTRRADEVGDSSSLSRTDLGLIAVALCIHRNMPGATLVSTDLAVLNTASHLGVRVLDPMKRLKRRIEWVYVCPACGNKERMAPPDMACNVCGTKVRRRAAKRSTI